MRTILFLFIASISLNAQKYQDLILEENAPEQIKSEQVAQIIQQNCYYLDAETIWHDALNTINKDQCDLYTKYTEFAAKHLHWIDEVKVSSQMDEAIGMEVEVVTFYKDGQEVEPKGFLESQVEPCKSLEDKVGVGACLTHFFMLGTEMKNLVDLYESLVKSAPKVFTSTGTEVKDELNAIKSNRSPAALKQVKELKNKGKSIDKSKDNATQLMPALTKSMAYDYSIIIGVTRTLKKMESGL